VKASVDQVVVTARDVEKVLDLQRSYPDTAHALALDHLKQGGRSTVLNCGYGHGFSVFDAVDTVKRVSGVDFKVDIAPRRDGDPPELVERLEQRGSRDRGRDATVRG